MKYLLSIVLLAGFMLTGCGGDSPPPDIVEEDSYINLLVELQLAKTYRESIPADSSSSTADTLIPQIFAKYGVTQDQFTRSHRYYQLQINQQKERIETAIERLRMDLVSEDTTDTAESPTGFDSLDIK